MIRYPSVSNHHLIEKHIEASSPIQIPSVNGFVFACCAASIALSHTNDLRLQKSVNRLFQSSIKMLFGLFSLLPSPLDSSSSPSDSDNEGHKEYHRFLGRFEHLLNRFDALLSSSFNNGFKNEERLGSLNFIEFWKMINVDVASFPSGFSSSDSSSDFFVPSALNAKGESTSMDDYQYQYSKFVVWLSIFHNFYVFQSLIPSSIYNSSGEELLSPSSLVVKKQEGERKTVTAASCLKLPDDLQSVLRSMLLSSNSWNLLFPNFSLVISKGISSKIIKEETRVIERTAKDCSLFMICSVKSVFQEELLSSVLSLSSSSPSQLNLHLLQSMESCLILFEKNQKRAQPSKEEDFQQFSEECRLPETLVLLIKYYLSSRDEAGVTEKERNDIEKRFYKLLLRIMTVCSMELRIRLFHCCSFLIENEVVNDEEEGDEKSFVLPEDYVNDCCLVENHLYEGITTSTKQLTSKSESCLAAFFFSPEIILSICWNICVSFSSNVSSERHKENANMFVDDNNAFARLLIVLLNRLIVSNQQQINSANFFTSQAWSSSKVVLWLSAVYNCPSFKELFSNEYDSNIHEPISLLISKLQHSSLSSSHGQDYSLSLLLQLFSSDSDRRIASIMYSKKYLLSDNGSSSLGGDSSFSFSSGRENSGRGIIDPFHGKSFLRLKGWEGFSSSEVILDESKNEKDIKSASSIPYSNLTRTKISKSSSEKDKKKQVSSAIFSHSDVKKLNDFAFSTNYDENQRTKSLQQMITMIRNDPVLLATYPVAWRNTMIADIVQTMKSILLLDDEEDEEESDAEDGLRRERKHQEFRFVSPENISKCRFEFCLLAIELIHLCFNSFPNLFLEKGCFFCQSTIEKRVDLSLFVALFLYSPEIISSSGLSSSVKINQKQLKAPSRGAIMKTTSIPMDRLEGITFYKKIIFLSTKLIHNIISSSNLWDLSNDLLMKHTLFPNVIVCSSSVSVDFPSFVSSFFEDIALNENSDSSLFFDRDITNTFRIAIPSSTSSTTSSDGLSSVTICYQSLDGRNQKHSSSLNISEITQVIVDLASPSERTLKMAVTSNFFDLIVSSKPNDQLRVSLLLIQMFSEDFSHLEIESMFLELRISVFAGLSNIVTVRPCLSITFSFFFPFIS
jgi:hypothetical protein